MRFLLPLLGVLFAGPAHAYVRTTTDNGVPMKWAHHCLPFKVFTGTLPANVTSGLFVGAVSKAAQTWSAPAAPGEPGLSCSQLRISVAEDMRPEPGVGFDGQFRVMFRKDDWCKRPCMAGDLSYDRSAIALTTLFARKSDGVILDADIEINATRFQWTDVAEQSLLKGGVRGHDIQNTITHEMGHVIGLDHSCYPRGGIFDEKSKMKPHPLDQATKLPAAFCEGASAEVKATTMFPAVVEGDLERRDLTPDDAMGACALYPPGGDLPCAPPPDDAGCSLSAQRVGGDCSIVTPCGGKGPARLVFLLAPLALVWRTRRSRKSSLPRR